MNIHKTGFNPQACAAQIAAKHSTAFEEQPQLGLPDLDGAFPIAGQVIGGGRPEGDGA
jgi:hypothetical protein